MKTLQIIAALLVLFTAFAAKADLSDSSLVPQKEMNFAKDFLTQIRERNFEYVLSFIDPVLSGKVSEEKLEEFAAYFPSGELLSVELIGSKVHTQNNTWHGNFSFEYEFESGWAIANTVMKQVAGETTVVAFNVYRTKASQEELNKFELTGKTAIHYTILILACAVPVFIFITLIYCVKTPMQKRKWLWILFILGGFGTISINWTTGLYEIKMLHYQLFGAAAGAASKFSPWVVTAGFPFGAIVFWYRRRSLIERENK